MGDPRGVPLAFEYAELGDTFPGARPDGGPEDKLLLTAGSRGLGDNSVGVSDFALGMMLILSSTGGGAGRALSIAEPELLGG